MRRWLVRNAGGRNGANVHPTPGAPSSSSITVLGEHPPRLPARAGAAMNRLRPKMPTVYIETYGCQMNVADTELMLGHLSAHGYTRTDAAEAADVILLNTCAIREHAEARVLGRLGELARHKRRRPDVRLGVTGCMAQHLREKLAARAPWVDVLVGPDGYRRLPELLRGGDGDPHVALRLDPSDTYADLPVARAGGVRAWVTVMRGCDRFCTFCIVPYVRGRALSTDVIVGFPGEDESDFACTEALVRRVRYDSAFLFKYSPREGTRAWKWGDTVPEDEKARRLQRLVALQETISAEINRGMVGAEVEVLVEGPARRTAGWMAGKSPQMKTVVFPGPAAPGDVVRVRIEAATSHTLTGEVLEGTGRGAA